MSVMKKYYEFWAELCEIAKINGDFKKILCHNELNQIEVAEWELINAASNLQNLKEESHA